MNEQQKIKEFSPGDIVQIRQKWGNKELGMIVKTQYKGSSYEFDKFEVLSQGVVNIYSREELDLIKSKKNG